MTILVEYLTAGDNDLVVVASTKIDVTTRRDDTFTLAIHQLRETGFRTRENKWISPTAIISLEDVTVSRVTQK